MPLTCHTLPPVRWAPLPPPAALAAAHAAVLVCRVPVAPHQPHAPRLLRLLTAAEQQRAHRYHEAGDYQRFIVRRAAARLLLGACIGQAPAELHFAPGPNQKPTLAAAPHLRYNVSHSGDWVLFAIAPVEIGIDLERVAADFPVRQLLAHSFSPPEQAFITQHPAPAAAFFQLWTRKEALAKATAQGIEADFSQLPTLDGVHEWAATPPHLPAAWAVSSFEPAAGYAAALAYPAAVPVGQMQFCEVADIVRWSEQ